MKCPEKFLLAWVSTIIMDILNDLLARCQRFPDTCVTVAAILVVKRHFVRYQLVNPNTIRVKFVSLFIHRKRASHVHVFQVRVGLCHSAFLWRLACEMSQQVHSIFSWESNLVSFEPRVVMDEVGEVRIVHDIETTSIVQLRSLGGSPKQSVLTRNVELTRPVSGFSWRTRLPTVTWNPSQTVRAHWRIIPYSTLDVMSEKSIDDYLNVDGDRDMSFRWTDSTRFILLNERTLEGYTWSGVRPTRKQTTSRPGKLWTDMWKHMSDAAKSEA